ncbi:hypothetical protein H9P43_006047 [Blastocladiella emersonii ATCC 22665]|nr:hypothetical protein H9P43_006047 [Blastocladiella emersonii ATCC 22665]
MTASPLDATSLSPADAVAAATSVVDALLHTSSSSSGGPRKLRPELAAPCTVYHLAQLTLPMAEYLASSPPSSSEEVDCAVYFHPGVPAVAVLLSSLVDLPWLHPRSGPECAEQFRAALGVLRSELAGEGPQQDAVTRWTLCLILGTLVRNQVAGTHGAGLRAVEIKVEAAARMIAKLAAVLRAEVAREPADVVLLGMYSYVVTLFETLPHRAFAEQLLHPLHSLSHTTHAHHRASATPPAPLHVWLYPARVFAALAPSLLDLGVDPPTAFHAAHRLLSLSTSHFSAAPTTACETWLAVHALRVLDTAALRRSLAAYPVFLVTLARSLAGYLAGPLQRERAACEGVRRAVVVALVGIQRAYAPGAAVRGDWEAVLMGEGEQVEEVPQRVVRVVEDAVFGLL